MLGAFIALAGLPLRAQRPWHQTFRGDVVPPQELRTNRGTYSPLMEILKPARASGSDAQLEQLKSLPAEDVWDAMGEYRDTNYVSGFQITRPGDRLVGRALTIRYLPPRPDLKAAAQQLAAEGDWDVRFNIRAGEEGRPGDVLVVDQGGASGSVFLGDISALAMKLRGIAGVVVDGGVRDVKELRGPQFSGFPVFARFFDARANWWIGVDWNVPVRIGHATVLPGDIVLADEGGVLFIPPQMIEIILAKAALNKAVETYQRRLIERRTYLLRDIYPLHPRLEAEFKAAPR